MRVSANYIRSSKDGKLTMSADTAETIYIRGWFISGIQYYPIDNVLQWVALCETLRSDGIFLIKDDINNRLITRGLFFT
jgi:hypothetical protein